MWTLCRDCAQLADKGGSACPSCNGKRLISHTRLTDLSVAHIDCDAFYAAIEKRDDPKLEGQPVIVGGGSRGVVATCCYIARLYGVRSAMPMFKALAACPHAIVLRPDYDKYAAASRLIRKKMQALTPLVQPVSIDEAYLDLSGTERVNGAPPAATLAKLASDIETDIGVTVSIGLSSNKFLAKTASELDKPRGFFVLSPEEAPGLLSPRAPDFLHGVGPKFAAKLRRDGYETIGDLQKANLKVLVRAYGETGLWLHQRAMGVDTRRVTPEGMRKSISAETTFADDLANHEDLEDHLWRLSVKTADRAKTAELAGRVITLKLKTRDFKTLTRRTSLEEATQLAQTIFRSASALLKKETGTRKFRLIGVGLSDLVEASGDANDLLDPIIAKRAAAERAADFARSKFGKDAVQTGRDARLNQKRAKD